MAATKLSFLTISTSDGGDFPRIIEIALFLLLSFFIVVDAEEVELYLLAGKFMLQAGVLKIAN